MEPRVEGPLRVLEDCSQRPAPGPPPVVEGAALEDDFARRRPDEPEAHLARGGLAGTRFADQAERLARGDLQADLACRMDVPPGPERAAGEVDID